MHTLTKPAVYNLSSLWRDCFHDEFCNRATPTYSIDLIRLQRQYKRAKTVPTACLYSDWFNFKILLLKWRDLNLAIHL